MKRIQVFTLAFMCMLVLVGCQGQQGREQTGAGETKDLVDSIAAAQIEAEATENDFRLKLYADDRVYHTDEAIQIWATLEYVGAEDTVTIWHGNPYIAFSITDGGDFRAYGVVHDILTSTELKKGEIYRFDYAKSGGYETQAPDADFWEEFFREDDLRLPAGTYTVSVNGAFYLSEQLQPAEKGPFCALQITVETYPPA